ncbi:MAG: CDP-alcohol phosphatidyltransferase family protein [Ignavibacteriae bacterium]|nr:MAG: CDP-alcohol phosphatidyltransferase family protein [Ignavibacteriota bacterium]
MENKFSYEKTLKTKPGESFLNFQSYLLVTAGSITKALYYTPVTPHQVILFSLVLGIASSVLLIQNNIYLVILGAVFLFYKNVFDKVDGSLARAKNMTSRRGRFYDSISDFIVSLSLFIAIGFKLYEKYNDWFVFVISFLGLLFSMLQCSFFIYYEVAFIKQSGKETINRLLENITEADKQHEDKFTLFLQKVFLIIYGWQDWIVNKTDKYLFNKTKKSLKPGDNSESNLEAIWYMNKPFLTIASIFSIGSHMVLIAVFSIAGKIEYYLFVNLILWNLLLGLSIIYQYYSVKNRIKRSGNGIYNKKISF